MDEGTLEREPENIGTQDERPNGHQHQEEHDQERNSDNEEESQHIENDEGKLETQDKRQGGDQHQEENDQDKGWNSDNEEEPQQIENDEGKLDTPDERQSGDQHQEENDQEKGRNSDNEEESHQLENEEEQLHDITRFDVATWPSPMPDDLRVEIVKAGSEPYQKRDGPFVDTVQRSGDKIKGKSRHFHSEWFYKALPNGEKVLRKWMVYSPIKKSLYCFCCKLFFRHHQTKQSFVNGFNSWWKLNPKVSEHENSESHLSCFEKWKILENGLRLKKTIDHEHQMVLDQEKKKWCNILSRLLDVILFLARQNLSLRGHREEISSDNRGNFLELVLYCQNMTQC